jgi:membrane protein implicated in regulation of membrane protease activity
MIRRILGVILIIYGCLMLLPGACLVFMTPLPFLPGWRTAAAGAGALAVSVALIWLGSRLRR